MKEGAEPSKEQADWRKMIKPLTDPFKNKRELMVQTQLVPRGIGDTNVLDAMSSVPRHHFVPERVMHDSYGDHPLPIGEGQTMSQPYIVALMTELLELPGDERLNILEVGTGSGYQAAILAWMGHDVVSVERFDSIARDARDLLDPLEYKGKVTVVIGDGSLGWPEKAPYDRVIITAAAPKIPDETAKQLKTGGILVMPRGDMAVQKMIQMKKGENELRINESIGCRFVPLIGEDGFH